MIRGMLKRPLRDPQSKALAQQRCAVCRLTLHGGPYCLILVVGRNNKRYDFYTHGMCVKAFKPPKSERECTGI